MKKNNYKPRIVKFVEYGGTVYSVDTRKGSNGLYPGDTYTSCGVKIMFLGMIYKTSIPESDGLQAFATYNDIGLNIIIGYIPYHADDAHGLKRHAQHLIDSGEMIQAEEI